MSRTRAGRNRTRSLMDSPVADLGSFRDRTARVVHHGGGIFRFLDEEAKGDWLKLKATSFFAGFMEAGRIVRTEDVPLDTVDPPGDLGFPPKALLHHERIPLVTYPYEWPFGMLQAAALLQLDLLLAAIREGMTLKDGTPYNVQWRGASPVFIDIPSLTRSEPGQAWDGYRQFCQLFLFPLMLQAYRGLDYQPWLRGALEGIRPEAMAAIMGPRDCLRPGVLGHVKLQAWLARRYKGTVKNVSGEMRQAGFNQAIVEANARRLRKTVERMTWRVPETIWRDYERECHYHSVDREQKHRFVESHARRWSWHSAWDLGCNTGEYSQLVARHGSQVLAMDADHAAVERLYRRLQDGGPDNVLPLVMNIADPSPGLGWRQAERRGLSERPRPDLVLCLALVHHVVIGAHVPLGDFVAWLGDLGGRLVIEFVDRSDPMVKRMLANKKERYRDYEREVFESMLQRHFEIEELLELSSGTRLLYAASPLRGADD